MGFLVLRGGGGGDVWAPFSMGVHCVVHRTNLAVQSLSNLTLLVQLEVFMEHLEFQKLVVTMETKGNKILKNVETS
jgi:hypothetical protein